MTIDLGRHAQFPFDLVGKQFVIPIWDGHYCLASRLEHAIQFLEKRSILFQMFQYVNGDYTIELLIGDWKGIIFERVDWLAQQLCDLGIVLARDICPHPFTAM